MGWNKNGFIGTKRLGSGHNALLAAACVRQSGKRFTLTGLLRQALSDQGHQVHDRAHGRTQNHQIGAFQTIRCLLANMVDPACGKRNLGVFARRVGHDSSGNLARPHGGGYRGTDHADADNPNLPQKRARHGVFVCD